MKRFLCASFSLVLLISLLTVFTVADDGEPPVTEEQQTELTASEETSSEDVTAVEDADSFEEPLVDETGKVEETGEKDFISETIKLTPEVESAILQINTNLAFFVDGIFPLLVAVAICFLFYKWFAITFF